MTTPVDLKTSKATLKAVYLLLLCLPLLMDKILEASAFSIEKKQCCHQPSTTRRIPKFRRNSISVILGYGNMEETDNSEYSDLDTGSFGSNSDSSTAIPTSNDSMTPEEVVTTCMRYLQGKGELTPRQELAGLETCYNFSSDSCRMANGGSLESFLQRANNPVFRTMVGCARWEVVNVGPEIAGTPTRGLLQTVLVSVIPRVDESGAQRNDRQFLWTIVKERRPPRQGHCLVHECVAVENAFAHTL